MLAPGIKATTTTSGTGTLTLAAVTGFPRPGDVFATGDWMQYYIEDGDNKEWGYGKVAATNTFTRDVKIAKYDTGAWSWNPATGISLSGGTATFSCSQIENGASSHVSQFRDWTANASNYGIFGMFGGSSLGSWAMSANHFFAYTFSTTEFMKIDEIGIQVSTAVASSKVRAAIYQAKPFGAETAAELIVESGELDTATTGIKTGAVDIVLPPGQYLGVTASNSTPTLKSLGAGDMETFCIDASYLYNMMRKTSGLTYGAMPSTLDISAWTYNNTQPACILFRRA